MAKERQPQVPSELRTVADHCVMVVMRSMNRAGVRDPLERCAVLGLVARVLEARCDHSARVAVHTCTSFAAIGRALGMSRQAAR